MRSTSAPENGAINPIIFAEVSMKFDRIEDADRVLVDFERRALTSEAGFLAGKAFLAYRRRGYFPALAIVGP